MIACSTILCALLAIALPMNVLGSSPNVMSIEYVIESTNDYNPQPRRPSNVEEVNSLAVSKPKSPEMAKGDNHISASNPTP
ncbi:hypothetical protein IWQ61_009962, partial [Dispira simplex]